MWIHDDVIKWKHFPCYWPFVRGIHRSPMNSPHKDQWRGALMFSLICVWMNDWVNNREAGDLRYYRAHNDVTVMFISTMLYGVLLSHSDSTKPSIGMRLLIQYSLWSFGRCLEVTHGYLSKPWTHSFPSSWALTNTCDKILDVFAIHWSLLYFIWVFNKMIFIQWDHI